MPTTLGVPVPVNRMPDGTFEAGAGAWVAYGPYTEIIGTDPVGRSGVALAFGRIGVVNAPAQLERTIAVTPGEVLSIGAWFRLTDNARNCRLDAQFYDGSGGALDASSGPTVLVPTGAYTQVVLEGLVAPAGAATLRIRPTASLPTPSKTVPAETALLDDVTVYAGAAANPNLAAGITVTTEDAAPNVAPHRISALGAYDDVLVSFAPVHDGQLVPSADLLPSDGTMFPDAGLYPDEVYPDVGALVPGDPRDIIGWIIRVGGIGIDSGKLVKRSSPMRCSPARTCGPAAVVSEGDYRVASGTLIDVPFTYADVYDGGGDGARDLNLYVLTESQSWS